MDGDGVGSVIAPCARDCSRGDEPEVRAPARAIIRRRAGPGRGRAARATLQFARARVDEIEIDRLTWGAASEVGRKKWRRRSTGTHRRIRALSRGGGRRHTARGGLLLHRRGWGRGLARALTDFAGAGLYAGGGREVASAVPRPGGRTRARGGLGDPGYPDHDARRDGWRRGWTASTRAGVYRRWRRRGDFFSWGGDWTMARRASGADKVVGKCNSLRRGGQAAGPARRHQSGRRGRLRW